MMLNGTLRKRVLKESLIKYSEKYGGLAKKHLKKYLMGALSKFLKIVNC